VDVGTVNSDTAAATDRLFALIERKWGILQALREVAVKQLDLVRKGCSMAELLRLLSAKQGVIDELTKVERDLDPFREQDPDTRVWRSPDGRARCAALASSCGEWLGEIMQMEKETEAAMIRRREATAKRLQTTSSALAARQAYGETAGHATPNNQGAFDWTSS